MDKRKWNTYRTVGYSYDVANDGASQGGVHDHQVRWTQSGWQHRVLQVNGWHSAAGPVTPIESDADGAARFATAEQEA